MKSTILKAAMGAAAMCSAASAFGHLGHSAHTPPSCPARSQCIVAGGDRLGGGTAALKREQAAASNDVPEPGTLALMGIGAIGVGYISRRYGARKA